MSIEAHSSERALLAILMHNPDTFFTVNEHIGEADFSNTGAGLIFSVLKDIILKDSKVVIDPQLIVSHAESKNLDRFFHHTINGELVDAVYSIDVVDSNLGKYVAEIKKASIKRALIKKCDDLKDEIEHHEGAAIEIRNLVETQILDSLRDIDSGEDDIICLADDFEEVINTYADREGNIGIDIGLQRWQEDIGHMRNGAITGVFASTKVGKSQFSMWAKFQAAVLQKKPTLYLDTELQPRQQQMRLCGIISGIPYNIIESGKWKSDREMIGRIKKAFQMVKDSPIFYKNIAGRSVRSVIPTIRKFVYRQLGGPIVGDEPKGLVIYDYIKMMDSGDLSRNLQEYQLIGLLLSNLHDCAAQLNIPILALGQLNKQEDIGIRRIVENVDSATVLRPKKQEEIEEDGPDRGSHALEVRYARNGPGHMFNEHINLHFDRSCGQFREDKRSSEVITVVKKLKEHLEQEQLQQLGDVREDW